MINRTPKTKVLGALSLAAIEGKTDAELAELRRQGWLLPIAGADGADDDDDKSKSKGKDGEDGEDDGGDDGEKIEVSKKEWDGVQSTIGALRRTVKKLEDAAESSDDDAAKEAGKWEDLYNKEKAKGEEKDQKIQSLEKGGTAREVAQRLNFHNPDRAVGMLDLSELDGEADFERALKALAKSDSYLVNAKKRTSGKVGDNDTAGADDNDTGEGTGKKTAEDTRSPDQKMTDAYAASSAAPQGQET